MINIYDPDIAPYTKSAIDAINSGWISNHGTYVEKSKEAPAPHTACSWH